MLDELLAMQDPSLIEGLEGDQRLAQQLLGDRDVAERLVDQVDRDVDARLYRAGLDQVDRNHCEAFRKALLADHAASPAGGRFGDSPRFTRTRSIGFESVLA